MTNRRKRTGDIGPMRVNVGPAPSSIEWLKIDVPYEKSNIAIFFAQRFVATCNASMPLRDMSITGLWQNPENSIDFRLKTSLGEKWLELMAFRPIEFFDVRPEQVPSQYNSYDVGKVIHGKIMEKSQKYRTAKRSSIFLLMYLDDWRFLPGNIMLALLQY